MYFQLKNSNNEKGDTQYNSAGNCTIHKLQNNHLFNN